MRNRLILFVTLALIVAFIWSRSKGTNWPIVNEPPGTPGIVCLGDSLTNGVGVGPGEAYPTLLGQYLGSSVGPVIPRGVNGRTIGEALSDLDHDVFSQGCGTVLILLGGNDQLRRIDPERAIDELDRIVQALQSHDLMVAVCDFSPVPGVHRAWARGFRDVASRRGCVLISGVADGLYTLDGDNQASDGIHLNAGGQRQLAERIALALAPHLGCDLAAVRARIVTAQGG